MELAPTPNLRLQISQIMAAYLHSNFIVEPKDPMWRIAMKVISLYGHISVQYYPYGYLFSLCGRPKMACIVYPLKPTSQGANPHRVCIMGTLALCGHYPFCTLSECIVQDVPTRIRFLTIRPVTGLSNINLGGGRFSVIVEVIQNRQFQINLSPAT